MAGTVGMTEAAGKTEAAPDTEAAEDSEESSVSDLFAKRVNIGDGRSMYIECRGEGSPTVLLLSGAGTASDLWHAADQKDPKVYPEVGTFTRGLRL